VDSTALPESARQLADVVGLAAAVRLIEEFGGTRLYVPAARSERLAALIGAEAAAALRRRWGGDELRVPLVPRLQEAAVAALYREGWSAARLARRFLRTEKWVYDIVRRAEAQRHLQRNGDLFDNHDRENDQNHGVGK